MPPLIAAILVGASVYAGYRAACAIFDRIARDAGSEPIGRTGTGQKTEQDRGQLVYDPVTGVYRPSRTD